MFTYTIKVRDNFIEEPQTLNTPIVDALLCVEVREIWNRGEHDPNLIIGLAVQFLFRVKSVRYLQRNYSIVFVFIGAVCISSPHPSFWSPENDGQHAPGACL